MKWFTVLSYPTPDMTLTNLFAAHKHFHCMGWVTPQQEFVAYINEKNQEMNNYKNMLIKKKIVLERTKIFWTILDANY